MTDTLDISAEPTTITSADSWKVREAVSNIDHERCDVCAHRAYVITAVRTADGEQPLSFCAHHFDTVGIRAGRVVRDARERLNPAS